MIEVCKALITIMMAITLIAEIVLAVKDDEDGVWRCAILMMHLTTIRVLIFIVEKLG